MEVVMRQVFQVLVAVAAAIGLVIAGLWGWQAAADLVSQWAVARTDVMVWAIRCGAIAVIALGQLLALRFAVGVSYRGRAMDDLLRLSSAVACAIALVSAVALGLAAR